MHFMRCVRGARIRWAVAAVALLQVGQPGPVGAQQAGAAWDYTQETVGREPAAFSTPVGFWSIATNGVDDKPVLFEDGTQWAGSQAANNFANQAQAVYGARWNEFIDDLPGLLVSPRLQVGVDEIVHRMQFLADVSLLMRGLLCRQIRGDGVLP